MKYSGFGRRLLVLAASSILLSACGGGSSQSSSTASKSQSSSETHSSSTSSSSPSSTESSSISKDTTAPVIEAHADLEVSFGEEVTIPPLTATDDVDESVAVTYEVKDPEGSVVTPVEGKFTPAKIGEYTITYNATDAAGNKAVPVTLKVTVEDATSPVIDFSVKSGYVAKGSKVTVTASDDVAQEPTLTLDVTKPDGTVETGAPVEYSFSDSGVYLLKAEASDGTNETSKELQVVVPQNDGEINEFEIPANAKTLQGLEGTITNVAEEVSTGKGACKVTVGADNDGWPGMYFDKTFFLERYGTETLDMTGYGVLEAAIYNGSSTALEFSMKATSEGKTFETGVVTIPSKSWGGPHMNLNDEAFVSNFDITAVTSISIYITTSGGGLASSLPADLIFDGVRMLKDGIVSDFNSKGNYQMMRGPMANQGAKVEYSADNGGSLLYTHPAKGEAAAKEITAFVYGSNASWADKGLPIWHEGAFSKLSIDAKASSGGFNVQFRIMKSDWSKANFVNKWIDSYDAYKTFTWDLINDGGCSADDLNNMRGIEFYINYAGSETAAQTISFDNLIFSA